MGLRILIVTKFLRKNFETKPSYEDLYNVLLYNLMLWLCAKIEGCTSCSKSTRRTINCGRVAEGFLE